MIHHLNETEVNPKLRSQGDKEKVGNAAGQQNQK